MVRYLHGKKRHIENALEQILPEDLMKKVRKSDLDLDQFLHAYHEVDRDKKKFKKLVRDFFSEKTKFDKLINLSKERIKTLNRLKLGLLQEKLKEVT